MATALSVVELFAGIGGFRLGLERASRRYQVLYANQWEPSTRRQHAAEVYRQAFGDSDVLDNRDIATVGAEALPEAQLLCAGFPCQDYSVATTLNRAEGIEGRKGVLWWQIVRLLREMRHRPEYLLLENVDRLLLSPASQRGRDMALILASLGDLCYDVEWRMANAADYGMPQRRRRTYLVAYQRTTPLALECRRYTPQTWLEQEGVMARALPAHLTPEGAQCHAVSLEGDLASLSANFNRARPATSPFCNAGLMRGRAVRTAPVLPDSERTPPPATLGGVLQDEVQVPEEYFIAPGDVEKWRYLKGSKRLERTAANGHVYTYNEGAMSFPDALDQPSRTVITAEGGASPSRFKHVVQCPSGRLRRLTPIELERLDMFPDNHTAGVPPSRRAFLLGNALVVGMVERLARELSNRVN